MKLLYFSFLLLCNSAALAMYTQMHPSRIIELNGKQKTMIQHVKHARKHPECTRFAKLDITRWTPGILTPVTIPALTKQDRADIKNGNYEYDAPKPLKLLNGKMVDVGLFIIGTYQCVDPDSHYVVLSCTLLPDDELDEIMKKKMSKDGYENWKKLNDNNSCIK